MELPVHRDIPPGLNHKIEFSMNAIRAMYDGTPNRIDCPVIEKVVNGISEITSQPTAADDVFVWESEGKRV